MTTADDATDDDLVVRRDVLDLVMREAPLTEEEVLRDMALPSHPAYDTDQVGRAIRDLAQLGLLHCSSDRMLTPTRAARAFARLPT